MRVLILGGSNLMGPPTVQRLVERGHTVAVFNRGQTPAPLPDAVERIRGERDALPDFADRFAAFAPDVVLHAICHTEAQARMACDVFDGMASRMVLLSSVDVYRAFGRVIGTESCPPEPTPLSETAPLRDNLFPYGPEHREPQYDKILVEQVALASESLPTTVLRLPMVWGPRDHRHRIYGYARRMAEGRPVIVLGETVARWRPCRAYVADVAEAIALAVERGRRRIYNVGDVHDLTERAWVEAIGAACGWSGRVAVVPDAAVPGHLRFEGDATQDLSLDSRRIRAELGFAETIGLPEALRQAVAWTLAHPPEGAAAEAPDYAAEDAAAHAAG